MEPKKNKIGILVNMDRCVGCHTCEVACRQENTGKDGKNILVMELGPKTVGGRLLMDYFPILSEDCTLCRHRLQRGLMPACVASCPTQALFFGDEYTLLDLLHGGNRHQICKATEI